MDADTCVIMPTIREYESLAAYAENARRHGVDLDRLHPILVTEDDCDVAGMEAMLDREDLDGAVFDARRRAQWFDRHGIGDFSHLIPDASHAQTSFGLLYMWTNGFDYGVFIDDDTRPIPSVDFFGTHLRNLAHAGPIERVSSDERWVNVLYQNFDRHGLYPRGYPYGAMDESIRTGVTTVDSVVASQGLWTEVPDLDAVRILLDGDLDGQANTRLSRDDYGDSFVTGRGHYLTICSMNLAFRREVIPAFYQLPMDDNRWDVGRFDDIWSGVFLKRACDVLDRDIISGHPLCEHHKAPRSTFGDLANEAPGLELNEHLWELTDNVGGDATTFAGVAAAIAERLIDCDVSYRNAAFLTHVGEATLDWLECLGELAVDRGSPPAVAADD